LDPSSSPHGFASWPALPSSPLSLLDFAGAWQSAQTCALVTAVMLFVAVLDTAGVQYMYASGAGLLVQDAEQPEKLVLPSSKMAFFAAGASSAVGQCSSHSRNAVQPCGT